MRGFSIFDDWKCNRGRPLIQIILVLFRMSNYFRTCENRRMRITGIPIAILYRMISLTVANIDIPPSTSVGRRLSIHHGTGLVINRTCVIGDDVVLRHCTTLGARSEGSVGPEIQSRVQIGPNSVVIGDITIGQGALIGAGSVVVKDVEAGSTVAGNPATDIREKTIDEK